MAKRIAKELRRHAPFTALGTVTGIIIIAIIIFGNVSPRISYTIFYILHPVHVVLSAIVTTAMYLSYRKGKIWAAILIGYTGSIGIATLSDVIIPDLGSRYGNYNCDNASHVPPFMNTEEMPVIGVAAWKVVNFAALIGIAIGYWKHITRVPHSGHVLLSTWASTIRFPGFWAANWTPLLPFVFLFLFLAVWIPCCTSDIVYPLLFIRKEQELSSQGDA